MSVVNVKPKLNAHVENDFDYKKYSKGMFV